MHLITKCNLSPVLTTSKNKSHPPPPATFQQLSLALLLQLSRSDYQPSVFLNKMRGIYLWIKISCGKYCVTLPVNNLSLYTSELKKRVSFTNLIDNLRIHKYCIFWPNLRSLTLKSPNPYNSAIAGQSGELADLRGIIPTLHTASKDY